MSLVYIAVGSNLGDRHENIQRSRRRLDDAGAHVRRVSPLYETQALLRPGQSERLPDFINGVFEIETSLDPESLLDLLEAIERDLGRVRKGDASSRPIDLDILLYEDRVVESPRLKIPHPEMVRRWFVLKPLADLAPDAVHPVTGKSVKQMLRDLSPDSPLTSSK